MLKAALRNLFGQSKHKNELVEVAKTKPPSTAIAKVKPVAPVPTVKITPVKPVPAPTPALPPPYRGQEPLGPYDTAIYTLWVSEQYQKGSWSEGILHHAEEVSQK